MTDFIMSRSKNNRNISIDVPVEYEKEVSDLLIRLMMEDKDEEPVQENKPLYEVSRISDHRITEKGWEFFVHFTGYREGYWITDDDCECEGYIKHYLQTLYPKVRTIYCFCRVSTKNQVGPDHVSLEAQEQRLLKTAKEKFGSSNQVRIKVYKISASAYKKIPDALRHIGNCAIANDVIMIYRVDRLSRNIIQFLGFLEEVHNKGVLFYAQDENLWYNEKKLEFIQLIIDANKESHNMGKRIRLALERRRQRGDEVFGSVPYGYSTKREESGRIAKVLNSTEQKVILRIKKELNKGKTPKQIAEELNHVGIRKRGRLWNTAIVKRLVNSL